MWSALARIFCSAHVGNGSETTVEQESQQVRASGIDSQKCCVDRDTPFDYPVREKVSEIPGRISIDLDGMYDIIISEKLSRALRGECEFALVGSETDSNNEPESKLIIVDGGCTTSLTSSLENCADCKPRITNLNFQGYSIVHHPDPDESGVFHLIKAKTGR